MTKAQFVGLKGRGFTLKFVTSGEDIKAKVAAYGDASFYRKSYVSGYGKVIKVKLVQYGEDVKLQEKSGYGDFVAG